MTKPELMELIDAFAAAKASGNVRLATWAAMELKGALMTLPESWGEETTEPPQPAAQPREFHNVEDCKHG